MKLDSFEFRIFRQLSGRLDLRGTKLLIACSGGLDSVALVAAMNKIAPKAGCRFAIATVHHGPSEDLRQTEYRLQSVALVRALAQTLRTKIFIARYSGSRVLQSEADYRKFRLRALEKIRSRSQYTHVVFAHHADDLFETRLMRLVRGTGPGGWQAMKPATDTTLRPFLFARRSEIEAYAKRMNLEWLEDPSNTENYYFRNWMRNLWLPQLEAKRPGSRTSFARSLEVMAESAETLTKDEGSPGKPLSGQLMNRTEFTRQSLRGRRQMIANCLRAMGVAFGRAHVEEIRKRLEVSTHSLEFCVLGLSWKVNAEQIEAMPTRQASQSPKIERPSEPS